MSLIRNSIASLPSLTIHKCFLTSNSDNPSPQQGSRITREDLEKKLKQPLELEPCLQKTATGENFNVMATTELKIAASCMQRGDYEAAVRHFQFALKYAPNFLLAHTNLGFCYLTMGQTQKGVEHLETALKLKPDDPERLSDFATAIFYHTRDEKKATELLEKAITLDPKNINHYITLALLKFSVSKLDEALVHLEEAKRINDRNYHVLFYLGNVYGAKGDFQKALQCYKQSVDIIEEHNRKVFESIKNEETRMKEAIEKRAKELEKLAAKTEEQKKKKKEASEDAEDDDEDEPKTPRPPHIPKIDPRERGLITFVDPYIKLADLLEDDAVADNLLKRAQELNPYEPLVLLKMAEYLATDEKYDEAVEHVKRALAIAPDSPSAHETAGTILTAIKRFQNALGVWSKFISFGDEQTQHRNTENAVVILIKHGYEFFQSHGDYDSATVCFEMIFDLVPDIMSGDPPKLSKILTNLIDATKNSYIPLDTDIIAAGLAVSLYRKGHKETAFAYFAEATESSEQREELLEWIRHSAPDLIIDYAPDKKLENQPAK